MDVILKSAGITPLKGDLTGIVRARQLSHAVMGNIRQNLFLPSSTSLLASESRRDFPTRSPLSCSRLSS